MTVIAINNILNGLDNQTKILNALAILTMKPPTNL